MLSSHDEMSTRKRLVITSVLIILFLGVLAVWEAVEQEDRDEKIGAVSSPQVVGHVGISIEAEPNDTVEGG